MGPDEPDLSTEELSKILNYRKDGKRSMGKTTFEEAEERLTRLLTTALGPSHKALDDLALLILARKTNAAYVKDALRYQLLRECSPHSSAHGAITINVPQYRNGRLIDGDRCLWGTQLDEYLDVMLKDRT